jgi:hypothetical protein
MVGDLFQLGQQCQHLSALNACAGIDLFGVYSVFS